jgi:hypothetical protein
VMRRDRAVLGYFRHEDIRAVRLHIAEDEPAGFPVDAAELSGRNLSAGNGDMRSNRTTAPQSDPAAGLVCICDRA